MKVTSTVWQKNGMLQRIATDTVLKIMKSKQLLTTSLVGTAIAAICCFTPVLVILLSAIGLSAAVAYLDIVLIPALVISVVISLFALWRVYA